MSVGQQNEQDEELIVSSFIMEEKPKIEEAIKNYISICMARVLSPGEIPIFPEEFMSCARILLRAINSHVLIDDHTAWGAKNPQGSNQLGIDRVKQLTRYKVLFLLHKKAAAKPGSKTCKLFGKSFFTWSNSWQDIRTKVLDEYRASSSHIEEEVIISFVDNFGASFAYDHDGDASINYVIEERIDVESDNALIWASDFSAVLRQRQQKRSESAHTRLQQQQQEEDQQQQQDEYSDEEDGSSNNPAG